LQSIIPKSTSPNSQGSLALTQATNPKHNRTNHNSTNPKPTNPNPIPNPDPNHNPTRPNPKPNTTNPNLRSSGPPE